jgi:hypothetical protein
VTGRVTARQVSRQFPHRDALTNKAASDAALQPVLDAYQTFATQAAKLTIRKAADVKKLVALANAYRELAMYSLEDRDNSGQENLRSSILEEFLGWLFKDVHVARGLEVPANFHAGKTKDSYLSLTFVPKGFKTVCAAPGPAIHTKDQDFVLGAAISITATPADSESSEAFAQNVVVPIVAIECKTYIAKNQLDSCAGTATRIKAAMPYCIYLVAAEFMKMDDDVTPELTDINEVFILCRAPNSERKTRRDEGKPPHGLDADLVVALFELVGRHLDATWWDPATALARGRIIARP